MATFSGYLRARSDDELVALLVRRPDLATPHPATLASLAARATSRGSLDRALAGVDALVLQVVESVVVLTGLRDGTTEGTAVVAAGADAARGDAPGPTVISPDRPVDGSSDGSGAAPGADASAPTRDDVLVAVGASADDAPVVLRAVDDAVGLALLWPDGTGALHAAPGVADALGASLAGLAPAGDEQPARRSPGRDGRASAPTVTGAQALALLAGAPAAASSVLDALTWGPPVGLVPPPGTPAAETVAWLVTQGLLVRSDTRHVVLPRHVALALRGGRTHRAPALAPSAAAAPVRDPAIVAAESARAAEQTVRLVRQLLTRWEQAPPGVLRAGGLGARDLRRTAQGLDVDDAHAAWLVETTASAGLLADDGEETPTFVPTLEADAWAAQDVAPRWAALAHAWLTSARTPWLVGGRDERGALRAALDPELTRPWVPRLRRAVLDVLAAAPAGAALGAADVHAALGWRTPRAVPPLAAVEAVLADAARLGVVGAGALASAGRALVGDADVAAALAGDLPAPVDEILLQGDLTGVVPGRPGEDLEDLLDLAAVVESRGGAVTVRFTPESVLRALDAGTTADDLLARLGTAARGRLPQPLEYLVRDVARRHGSVRAGAASSYVRADDPALLAGLVDDPRWAALRPRLLAPTVLVADATPGELLDALRARGLAPVAEDARGTVVRSVAPERRVRARGGRTSPVRERPVAERAASVVATLRRGDPPPDDPGPARPGAVRRAGAAAGAAGDERDASRVTHSPADAPTTGRPARAAGRGVRREGPASGAPAPGTSEPGDVLVLLREAAQARTSVWVEIVGPDGRAERRLVRPLKVEGGRLRALDPRREAELTVAVHRIAGVAHADDASG